MVAPSIRAASWLNGSGLDNPRLAALRCPSLATARGDAGVANPRVILWRSEAQTRESQAGKSSEPPSARDARVKLAHDGWRRRAPANADVMAPPHPMLMVESDGKLWQVDLGNPNQTERSGFRGDTAKPGDAVTALGNRHLDKTRLHMKAVRITIAGTNYDMYPERIRTN